MNYTLAIGTSDPENLTAESDAAAIRQAVELVEQRYGEALRLQPQEVATLIGPAGLLTGPSERLDEFVRRLSGSDPVADEDTVQPGDSNTPDCNGG